MARSSQLDVIFFFFLVKFLPFDSVCCRKISLIHWHLFFQSLNLKWGQVNCPKTFVEIRSFINFWLFNYLPQRFRNFSLINFCFQFRANFFEIFRNSPYFITLASYVYTVSFNTAMTGSWFSWDFISDDCCPGYRARKNSSPEPLWT